MNLESILETCVKYNVKKVKFEGVEVEFGESQNAIPVFDAPLKEPIGGELKPTADELLFWSTGEQIEIESKPPEI